MYFTKSFNYFIPESEQNRAVFWARVHIVIYATTVLVAIITQLFLPVVLIGGPRIYGVLHAVMASLLQHGGLAQDILDHRLNSSTVYPQTLAEQNRILKDTDWLELFAKVGGHGILSKTSKFA